jgi:hypothetical protein
MSEPSDPHADPRQRQVEFEDRHFEDDADIVPTDDIRPRAPHPSPKPRAARRPPARHDPDDD